MIRFALSISLFTTFFCASVIAEEPPTVPVGLDAYRQWDRWAYQRIGVRAYMRSTYDRTGHNQGADASHYLYQTADDFNVSLDVENPGILYFARYNHWHGSPWHYEVDGRDTIVQETATAALPKRVKDSVFLPEKPFPSPLTFTWATTKGADLMWVPIPFEKRFRMAYSRTHYGTGYYIFHQFVRGSPLSQPIKAWDGESAPDQDVLDLLGKTAGTLLPPDGSEQAKKMGLQTLVPSQGGVHLESLSVSPDNKRIPGDESYIRNQYKIGKPGVIREMKISFPVSDIEVMERSRIRIVWDDRKQPSVDAPVPLFFGSGTFYNRNKREYLVKAFPMKIRLNEKTVELTCNFPMPFFDSCRIDIVTEEKEQKPAEFHLSVQWQPYNGPANHVGYFHATYKDHTDKPEPGQDLVLLDTKQGIEGSDVWSGSFVGTSFIFSHDGKLRTLEGDPRFFFDDSNSPQAQGTGTEEWGGGGDYWGGNTMTLPFAGHPVGVPDKKDVVPDNDRDKIESAYRFLLADMMPFGRNAKICLEHGGHNDSVEHYESVTYWYGLPAASLVKTDTLQIGDEASEKLHSYNSPNASKPYEITSRYELGWDQRVDPEDKKKRIEVFPPHKDTGRTTKTASEFTLKLQKENLGVMLRRKLDYQFHNQRAEVFIADASNGEVKKDGDASKGEAEKGSDFKLAGIWYTAGSNTCIWSFPKDELGETMHQLQTSNRRFRDDEFLVPRDLTEGRSAIRVRVIFTPVETPISHVTKQEPPVERLWSEIRYDAYCYEMPKYKISEK